MWEAIVPVCSLNLYFLDFSAKSLWHLFMTLMALFMEFFVTEYICVTKWISFDQALNMLW